METAELLKRLRRIEIRTSRLANREMAGQYRSVFRGHGMSFDEVRPYQQGDDVRLIDWNVSARTGEPFVKVFVEERELTVFLLLDLSESSRFGTRGMTRRDLIVELAGIHAFSAIKNNDRVGLIVFTDRVEHFVPPKKGRTHVLRVIRDILEFERGRGNLPGQPAGVGLAQAVGFLTRVTKKTAVAFLVSDFFLSPPEIQRAERVLSIACRRHDMVAYVTRDQADEELPAAGLLDLEDPETGQMLLTDSSSRWVRGRFRRAAARDRDAAQTLLRRLSIDFEVLWTHADCVPALNRLFRKRARRM